MSRYKDPEYARKYYQTNRDKVRARVQRNALSRRYGLSWDEYQGMFVAQQGLCAICGKPETRIGPEGVPTLLSVDHNHDTGEIRELLCSQCNTALGMFQENPALLAEAIVYLERHKE